MSRTAALEHEFESELVNSSWLRRFETALTSSSTPAIGFAVSALTRCAMEVRLAKLGIGIQIFRQKRDRWPSSIKELTEDEFVGDLGPVVPVGNSPFGYRVVATKAELWGFEPEFASDSTPDQPIDPSETEDEDDDHLEYWYWVFVISAENAPSPPK